jgi:hypothetical protein
MGLGFTTTLRRTIVNAGTQTLTGSGNTSLPFGVNKITVTGKGGRGNAGTPATQETLAVLEMLVATV